MTTVCLNMIVKNEVSVMPRCLAAVRDRIDYWVIVDTGSTDGTQELIRKELVGVPGELIERPWVNFGHNRSEAVALARDKADYTLVVDADETFVIEPDFTWPTDGMDSYQIKTSFGNVEYWRTQLMSTKLPWRYDGILHEYPTCEQAKTQGQLTGIVDRPATDGARSKDPQKFRHDAELLEEALKRDCGHLTSRYKFYCAQSWRDAGELEKAREWYQKRAELGGWAEEVWFSLYMAARISEFLKLPEHEVMSAYLTAYQYRPSRAESLHDLSRYMRSKLKFALALLFAEQAMRTPPTSDKLFVTADVYSWRAADEFAISAYYMGRMSEAREVNERLLASSTLPAHERPRLEKNLSFCRQPA